MNLTQLFGLMRLGVKDILRQAFIWKQEDTKTYNSSLSTECNFCCCCRRCRLHAKLSWMCCLILDLYSRAECDIILSAYTDVKALSIILHSAIILHVKFTILEVFDKLRKSTQRRKSTQYDKQDFSFVYKIFLWIQDYWFNSYGTRYFSVILKIRSKILRYQGFLSPIVFLLSIQYISNIRLHCDSCMTYYITL
jgi:hypothetical protein